jgi:crotonobetainyl-CoA:carnitine CoA-transferase CaiB-like acyl-CoA transferase
VLVARNEEALQQAVGEIIASGGEAIHFVADVANREELVEILQREFAKRPADEWVEEIRDAGVPCGPVNALADVFTDEHVLSSGILHDVDHPAAGILKMLASPVLVDDGRLPIRRPPPTLGQHTREGW